MIVVIADDLSGATEIAGIGRRSGLSAQVQHRFLPTPKVDLVVVNTQTRKKTRTEACEITKALCRQMAESKVAWCFKKVDSVLRGHVLEELLTTMRALNKPKAILAPANPSRGRTIVQGQYLIDNQPLHKTDFAYDPEYPVASSNIIDLLRASNRSAIQSAPHDQLGCHTKGIVVAEVQSTEDLAPWAGQVDESTLPCGGADFFTAIITRRLGRGAEPKAPTYDPAVGKTLIVCGSASAYSRAKVEDLRDNGIPVCPMPKALFKNVHGNNDSMARWIQDVETALQTQDMAVVAITEPVQQDITSAHGLRSCKASLVQAVLDHITVQELFIEGGATAETIISLLNWTTLHAIGEFCPGVVQLSPSDSRQQRLTVKPGSYPWPNCLTEKWAKAKTS